MQIREMKEDHRGSIFGQLLKLTWECQKHQGEIANMVVVKDDEEIHGLACALCLPNQLNKEDPEVRSLKMVLLQIHQSCQTLMTDAITAAFVDHHIFLIRGIVRNQFKDIEPILQPAVTNYFQKIRQLLNGKYFQQFYQLIASILALKCHPEPTSDHRKLQKLTSQLMKFMIDFEKLASENEDYLSMSLEDRLLGKNFGKYIRKEVGDIYKEVKEKSQSLKKNCQTEEILELFNISEKSTKSFKFSSSLLHSDLKYTDPKSISMPDLPENEEILLALIQPPLGNNKRSIKLKMQSIQGWIAIGIAYRSQVEASSFRFNQMSHGTVQMSFDGYSWSSDSSVNEQYTSWYFNQGDIITITADPPTGELIFQRGQDPNTHTLKYTKEKKEKIYFCVSMNYNGDAVNILE